MLNEKPSKYNEIVNKINISGKIVERIQSHGTRNLNVRAHFKAKSTA